MIVADDQLEGLAMEIYWTPYDGVYGRHRTGDPQRPTITLDMAKAWAMASETQRQFSRRQAARALSYIEGKKR